MSSLYFCSPHILPNFSSGGKTRTIHNQEKYQKRSYSTTQTCPSVFFLCLLFLIGWTYQNIAVIILSHFKIFANSSKFLIQTCVGQDSNKRSHQRCCNYQMLYLNSHNPICVRVLCGFTAALAVRVALALLATGHLPLSVAVNEVHEVGVLLGLPDERMLHQLACRWPLEYL